MIISSLDCRSARPLPALAPGTPCMHVPAIVKDFPTAHYPQLGPPRVLVSTGGGSIGAHPGFRDATNDALAAVLDTLAEIEATGHISAATVVLGADATLPPRGAPAWLTVIDKPVELTTLYAHHEVFIARAGRNATAEALRSGIPTVLLPVSADPHRGSEQLANANAATHSDHMFAIPDWQDARSLRTAVLSALHRARSIPRRPGQRGNDAAVRFLAPRTRHRRRSPHRPPHTTRKAIRMTTWDMTFRALPGIGLVEPGTDLASTIAKAAADDGFTFTDGDVVVVAQKVVSKAENRIVNLADINAIDRAQALAARTGRDARLCQLYLDESQAVIEVKGRHVVTIDRRGFQGTGAGVDMSNIGRRADGWAVLLPQDPDASARQLRDGLREQTGVTMAVIISDSFGSPVREGAIGAAIGIAGIRHLEEPDGEHDLYGNPSKPIMNRVDEIAATASILMGQTDAGRPVIVGRGVPYTVDENASLAGLLNVPPLPEVDFDLRPEF
ncbi:MAG: coenzyme F420-0:L-glutamate ligase [Angustibacter sp.]